MYKIEKQYPYILIIGNGFDLNLGLRTSYTDFIKSKNFIQLINNQNYLAIYLQKQHGLQNWIDIENELKKYSNLPGTKAKHDSYENDFKNLSNALKDYLLTIEYSNLDTNSKSYKLLKDIKDKEFLILDFNYTKTVKTVLKELGLTDVDINERLIKVHGSLEENQIIFGIEDGATINREHIFLRKGFNNNYKGVSLKTALDNVVELYIFGHSLGETDHMYFKRFFQLYSSNYSRSSDKKIHLYYYGSDGYKQLFMQLDSLTNRRLSIFRQNNELNLINTLK